MSRTRKITMILATIGFVLILSAGCAPARRPAPTPAEEPRAGDNLQARVDQLEAHVQDQAPNGCPDCHKRFNADRDFSLKAIARRMDRHPVVKAETLSECMECHDEGKWDFERVMHRLHLNSARYREQYDQNCKNCHFMQEDGTIVTKGWRDGGRRAPARTTPAPARPTPTPAPTPTPPTPPTPPPLTPPPTVQPPVQIPPTPPVTPPVTQPPGQRRGQND